LKLELVFIKPGTFQMGATEPANQPGNAPQIVTISQGFWMGKTPVTQEQWKRVRYSGPDNSNFKGDNLPVESLTWKDAMVFCQLLNDLLVQLPQGKEGTSYHFRLPTEAEWEYACRAGHSGRFPFPVGYDPKDLPEYDWVQSIETHPLTLKANAFGLMDMLGDVQEWCFDGYPHDGLDNGNLPLLKGGPDPNLPSADWTTTELSPQNLPTQNLIHVMRGASYRTARDKISDNTVRKPAISTVALSTTGFRVVLAPVTK
jgi:formylglycine-generating enzyme required for sulfatase activity